MALIETKDGKKIIKLNESDLLHQSHLQHVVFALEAFADSKRIYPTKDTPTSSSNFQYVFTFPKSITLIVLKRALSKLKVNLR